MNIPAWVMYFEWLIVACYYARSERKDRAMLLMLLIRHYGTYYIPAGLPYHLLNPKQPFAFCSALFAVFTLLLAAFFILMAHGEL